MSTHQQPPSQPEVPAELWMLWDIDENDWIADPDDESPVGGYLVYFSQPDAKAAKAYHDNIRSIPTKPVRVK